MMNRELQDVMQYHTTGTASGYDSRDFKIHYGEALVRRMQPKETGPTTASPAKTRIDYVLCSTARSNSM